MVVTTCTDRKRYAVPPELDASSLPAGRQANVAHEWRRRVSAAPSAGLAAQVYCGRSFQEAILAARAGRAELRIISGGLGLIRSDEAIPSYSLSLVRQSREFVGSRVLDAPFRAPEWWSSVQKAGRAPMAEVVRANPTAIAVIGISSTYLSLVADDLASLGDNDIDRIRLIGMGIEKACPRRLQPYILPYNDRLDGRDSPIRGTRGDFASRAVRHFIQHVLCDQELGSIETHQAAVNRYLSNWQRPKTISRPSKTDAEIIALIKKNWNAIDGQSSKGLRYLRDVEEIACEQSRFRALFSRAAEEVRS